MAANAAQNGDPRDMNAFFIYGEWKGEEGENLSSMSYPDSCSVSTVRKCAWYDAWKKHSLLKEGTLYCHYVDAGLAEGFGGTFRLDVEQAIGKGDAVCIFRWNRPCDPDYVAYRRKEDNGRYILPFSFHLRELLEVTGEYLARQVPGQSGQIIREAWSAWSDIFTQEVIL